MIKDGAAARPINKHGWGEEQKGIPELLNKASHAKQTRVSFEVIPPVRGSGFVEIARTLDALSELDPCFISVTSHNAEVLAERLSSKDSLTAGGVGPDGTPKKRIRSVIRRPGTVGICAALRQRYPHIPTLAHMICLGKTADEMEDTLIELDYLGIRNIFALRGDGPLGESTPQDQKTYQYASDLVHQISQTNAGEYIPHTFNAQALFPTQFSVGVAGYPEKHEEATTLSQDIAYLKNKVDMGAQYVITQMFFDNNDYFSFVKQCVAAGIHVPIIPGLKPLSTLKHLEILPSSFAITLPEALVKEVFKAQRTSDPKSAIREIGREWCMTQARELIAAGVPLVHFYTMNRYSSIKKICKEVF